MLTLLLPLLSCKHRGAETGIPVDTAPPDDSATDTAPTDSGGDSAEDLSLIHI